MGATGSVPEADERMKKAIALAELTPKEVKRFYRTFRRFDKARSGLIPLQKLFESMEDSRTVFTDSLLELLEIEHDGRINFSSFLLMVVTYCLFEPQEILKFCFFVFDQDKHGYFEQSELKLLMNILHKVEPGETVKGNIKISWQSLAFSHDDRVDFDEFLTYHKEFPRLFGPAFKLHLNMTRVLMGNRFWNRKKRLLQVKKDEQRAKEMKKKLSHAQKAKKAAMRKTRKKMGILRYYMCPCLRFMYDGSVAVDLDPIEEDRKRKRAAAIAAEKRRMELAIKNPETHEWKLYQTKKEKDLEGGGVKLEEKQERIGRKRNERQEKRAERRKKRNEDEDIKASSKFEMIDF